MMKLFHSFKKELVLSSKSYYFYIELFMALILLLILLFVVPENFNTSTEEYVYLDLPAEARESYYREIQEGSSGIEFENMELEIEDGISNARYYKTEDSEVYFVDSEEAVKYFAEQEGKFGATVFQAPDGKLSYRYYMQGYESEKLKNIYKVIHSGELELESLAAQAESQRVKKIGEYEQLSDRENMIPVFLTVNGSLMGLFIIASYIFLDRQEGIIQAYAVTPAPVWMYLMSKVGVIITSSLAFSLILLLPTVGTGVNYGLLFVLLVCSGLFATSIGLIITSYYRDMMKSFGTLYVIIMLMMIPSIAYFIPNWEPAWVRFIPTYYMIESFKELLLKSGDSMYVLYTSAGFLASGVLLFAFANYRFKKTLLV